MNYIVAADRLCCFYYKDGGIWFCEFKDGVWSETRELISKARKNFTVSLVNEKALLIWQDDKGNLNRGRFNGENIITEVLIKGSGGLGQYRAMPTEGGVNLIYNLPISGDDVNMLMTQFVGTNGAWGAAGRVDNISSMADGLFKLIPVAGEHFLAVYQNGGFESRLGYREIYGGEVGRYNLIHSSIHKFAGYSFLATKYDLHCVCVVKGVFGSRLIYKKKGTDGLTPGIVVAEGQNLHNIMLCMVDEKLRILFVSNDKLYCMGARDDGYGWAFLPLEEHEKSLSGRLSKAVFLSTDKGSKGILANELLVHEEKPWEIKVFENQVFKPYLQAPQAQETQEIRENPPHTEEEYNKFFDDMENELIEFMGG